GRRVGRGRGRAPRDGGGHRDGAGGGVRRVRRVRADPVPLDRPVGAATVGAGRDARAGDGPVGDHAQRQRPAGPPAGRGGGGGVRRRPGAPRDGGRGGGGGRRAGGAGQRPGVAS